MESVYLKSGKWQNRLSSRRNLGGEYLTPFYNSEKKVLYYDYLNFSLDVVLILPPKKSNNPLFYRLGRNDTTEVCYANRENSGGISLASSRGNPEARIE